MQVLLGVDGGNSKTLAAVADESGHVIGVGRAPGTNYQAIGLPRTMDRIRQAAEAAFSMAGITTAQVIAASYCLSGADMPEDFARLTVALDQLGLAQHFELDNDCIAILRAGTNSGDAVAVCWGSGCNALGRSAAGETFRLPALGWISGDWGGGDDLARETVRLVARAHDGRGEPTMLQDLVLNALAVPDVDEMIRMLYHNPKWEAGDGQAPNLRRIPPLLFEAARAGDPVARGLVKRAGGEVATMATAVLRRLRLLDRPADVVLGGGVLQAASPLLLDTISDRLMAAAPQANVIVQETDPVVGAMFCAMDLVQIPVDEAVRETARWSYEHTTAGARAAS